MKLPLLPVILALAIGVVAPLAATPIVPVSYVYNQGPNGYWDETGDQLTDGLYNALIPGVNLAVPNATNWVGWSGGTPSITFDFGTTVTIDSVDVSMAHWTLAAVYLPNQVDINSSVFAVNPGNYPDLDHALLRFNGSWTGSTLTLTLTPSQASTWTFIDEVTFNEAAQGGGSGNAVPDAASTFTLLAATLAGLAVARKASA